MNRCIACVLSVAVSGCATTVAMNPNERPTLVDPARTNMTAYQKDYGECAGLANMTDAQGAVIASTAVSGTVGAVAGGIIGGIIGAALGDTRTGIAWGAALGGAEGVIAGATGGYGDARQDQEGTLRRCLAGRGYNLIR